MTAFESEAAMAARADAERRDDALGGGSGGACPTDTRDVDDVARISAAASNETDDVDDDLLSVACPSDNEDVEDANLSVDPPSEASDVDETIFWSVGIDCPLRSFREDRRGGIGGGGPAITTASVALG
jgi:hypothetical protein